MENKTTLKKTPRQVGSGAAFPRPPRARISSAFPCSPFPLRRPVEVMAFSSDGLTRQASSRFGQVFASPQRKNARKPCRQAIALRGSRNDEAVWCSAHQSTYPFPHALIKPRLMKPQSTPIKVIQGYTRLPKPRQASPKNRSSRLDIKRSAPLLLLVHPSFELRSHSLENSLLLPCQKLHTSRSTPYESAEYISLKLGIASGRALRFTFHATLIPLRRKAFQFCSPVVH
jgi:hypothetical protein